MTSATGPRAINCTSCGAGQNVLGGGRVKVHVCDFCGAALDAAGNFNVLAKFSKAQDLGSPFVPGMQGEIDGIEWTVIGTLERTESWGGANWQWYEHQLYSDTHGYAWLSVEEGHLIFSRRMRGATDPEFMTMAQVERAENRPSARVMDDWIAFGELDVPLSRRRFKYHESGQARTRRAAGAFTWLPSVGDKDRSVTFVRDTEALTFTESPGGVRETTLSRYLPQLETYQAFKVPEDTWASRGDHVLEPFVPGRHEGFVKKIFLLCCAVSLVLGLYLLMGGREQLAVTRAPIPLSTLPQAITFDAPNDDRMVLIRLTAYPNNGWAGFEVEIVGPSGDTLGFHEVGIQRYSGRDADGSWSEGRATARMTVRPKEPGEHQAIVTYTGFEPWASGRSPSPPAGVEVDVRAKRGVARWPLIAAGVFGLMLIFSNFRSMAHYSKRQKMSDWVDEEDDD